MNHHAKIMPGGPSVMTINSVESVHLDLTENVVA